MKTFLLGFVAAFVLIPACVLGYSRLGLAGTGSDANPSAWETLVMQSAVRASVRRSAKGIQARTHGNDDDAMVEGGRLYLNGCAGCHGTPGKPSEDLSSYPRVPQLPQVGTRYSEPEIHWIVQHGIRNTAMSAYGPFYSDKEMWALATFLKRIDNLPPGMMDSIQTKSAVGSSKN
jgi:mono/diheme cytochrome c family protein